MSDPDNFSTLVTAVQTAGLVDALSSAGPFTVFAPTNEAFAALPEGTLASLLDDPEALADILLYHVVPGTVLAQDIPAFLKADTLLGDNVIELRSSSMDGVTVNDATVTAADIQASNGVIHVIDQVLIPGQPVSSRGTIVDVAAATDATSTLVQAVQAASSAVIDTLSSDGKYTVFAPTNDAFAALPQGLLEDLLADQEKLTNVLLYHVLEGQVESADIPRTAQVDTLLGQSVVLVRTYNNYWCNWFELPGCAETITINGVVNVVIADIPADNGVIHVIDQVLAPEGLEMERTEEAVKVDRLGGPF